MEEDAPGLPVSVVSSAEDLARYLQVISCRQPVRTSGGEGELAPACTNRAQERE